MSLSCLGLNYRTAPVEIRECFAIARPRLAKAEAELLEQTPIDQCVVLSTCNRMEIYFCADDHELAAKAIREYFTGSRENIECRDGYFYQCSGVDAMRHLCRVLSGLDSMVLGETEIFGQVKEAYRIALSAGMTGGILNKVFQKAFSIGKKVRRETKINVGATSIGSVAVDLAGQIFGELKGSQVLILGAGEMSRVTAQSLKSRGAKSIFVANRTHERAEELARMVEGEAIRYEQWCEYLKHIDIVIAATSAPHYVITRDLLLPLREARKFRSLFLIDISVPRNIDPATADIDEVYVYDIDTLRLLADEARRSRAREIRHCEDIIEQDMMKHFPTLDQL
ncbi:glutamyl-tRNA reductase [Akkermansia sp. N21169]|jgi:glutamyl-tRNA reductase|uniref:glutamyl-tRNA reductase n=1 Tax=Akkermansia sp. N21169 TaxID=3040765 RepID=UPI00244EC532|nr:glutamyl-tRNA reductase [Akkermansia sp. N21169]MDH3069768.1 glutamyl-tRNA reductase [Akkermansia sp. N21169]